MNLNLLLSQQSLYFIPGGYRLISLFIMYTGRILCQIRQPNNNSNSRNITPLWDFKIYDLLKWNKTTKVQFIKLRNTNSFWYPIDIQMFFYLHYISLSFLHYSIEKELSRYYKNQLQFVHFRVPMRQRINLWLISKVIYQLIVLYIATTGTKHLEMPTNVWFRVHGMSLLGQERTTSCIYLSHSHKSLEVQERHD